MGALISWVCKADHQVQERSEYAPVLTVNQGAWAFCQRGGAGTHSWHTVEPTPIERLRYLRATIQAVPEAAMKR